MNNLDGISGVGTERKSYLQTKTGYYLSAFNTLIKKATDKDIALSKHYALELVSDYDNIDIRLLSLKKIDHKQELAYYTDVYEVRIGKLIQGQLYLTISNLIKVKTITINYYNRVSYQTFNKANGIKHKYDKKLGTKHIQRKKQYNHRIKRKYRK